MTGLSDLQAGRYKLSGYAGKVLRSSENLYVKLLTDPTYNQTESRWEALAQVNDCLAIIEVSVKVTAEPPAGKGGKG